MEAPFQLFRLVIRHIHVPHSASELKLVPQLCRKVQLHAKAPWKGSAQDVRHESTTLLIC